MRRCADGCFCLPLSPTLKCDRESENLTRWIDREATNAVSELEEAISGTTAAAAHSSIAEVASCGAPAVELETFPAPPALKQLGGGREQLHFTTAGCGSISGMQCPMTNVLDS